LKSKVSLGELCTYSKGIGIPREYTDVNLDIPYLHYGDIYKKYDFRINLDKELNEIIKISKNEKIKTDHFLSDGDIVYTLTSETVDDLGHSTLIINEKNYPFVAGMETTVIRIKDKNKILPAYLNYIFQSESFRRELRQFVTGMKVYRVHPTDLLKIKIDIPSLEDQLKIVSFLDSISNKIQINIVLNDYLSTLKTEMFSNYLGSLKDCETVSLAEVATLQKETWKPSNVEEILEHYSIPAYDQNQFPIFDNSLYVKSNKTLVEKDCILVSKLNPETKRVWRPLCMTNLAVCSTEFLAIKAKNPDMKEYIHSFVESDLFTQHLTSIATGSTGSRQRALPSDAMSCVVPIPPLDVKYTVLMNALSDLSKSIKQNVMENDRLTNLRDYLLPKLMSGEINVSNLELSN